MNAFFILGLPRTKEPWLANLFNYTKSTCYLNPSVHFEKIEDIKPLFEISKKPYQGVADSTLTLFHREINEFFDAPPIILIDRDYKEVILNIAAISGIGESLVTEAIRRQIEQIRNYDNCLTIPYHDLGNEKIIQKVWEHCLPGDKFNHIRWMILNDLIIEADNVKLSQLVSTNFDKLSKFIAPAIKEATWHSTGKVLEQ